MVYGDNEMKRTVNNLRSAIAILLALIVLIPAAACKDKTGAESRPKMSAPVTELKCTAPASLSAIYPTVNNNVIVCWTDYDANITTISIVDIYNDTVTKEIVIDGAWVFKDQSFADNRMAFYNFDLLEWKFYDTKLSEINTVKVENINGFWSYDGSAYYYLSDRVLCMMRASDQSCEKVRLDLDLRFLSFDVFDNITGEAVTQFYLSNYSGECGTAVININTGKISMLQNAAYQAFFRDSELCFMSFDDKTFSYSLYYGKIDGDFHFADSGLFLDSGGEIYGCTGSPYLTTISDAATTLYRCDAKIAACKLKDVGIDGEMRNIRYIKSADLLVGAVYLNNAFKIYVIDPSQLQFEIIAEASVVESPVKVDENIASDNFKGSEALPLAKTLADAKKQAETLEEKYKVTILMSTQCRDAVALCQDRTIHLSDSLGSADEIKGVRASLDALNRTLSLYPNGFFKQFRNKMGECGIRILLVGEIESKNGTVGVEFESFDWQNIAIDIRMTDTLDSIICHEIWHATENHILSKDYTAFDPDKWRSINPKGFEYNESSGSANKDPLKWTYDTAGNEGIYFVDGYGRTNAKEDRARIMEYFMAHQDTAKQLVKSPAIKQKMQMMCDAIRKTFDTTGWKNVRWEKFM